MCKSFLNNPNSKTIAYLGHTSYALTYPQANLIGPTNEFLGEFYKSLLTDNNHRYGTAFHEAQITLKNQSNYNSGNHGRWTLLGMNLTGDPETPVYLTAPQTFNNVYISYHNGFLIIYTNTIGCHVCVRSKNDNGTSLYISRNIPTGMMHIPAPVDECEICITKQGYIPYITSAVNQTYVQNQTFTESHTIVSGETYIGRDVTTTTSEGPVIVQDGTLTINSPKKVFIKNSFKVQSGAKLKINP